MVLLCYGTMLIVDTKCDFFIATYMFKKNKLCSFSRIAKVSHTQPVSFIIIPMFPLQQ